MDDCRVILRMGKLFARYVEFVEEGFGGTWHELLGIECLPDRILRRLAGGVDL